MDNKTYYCLLFISDKILNFGSKLQKSARNICNCGVVDLIRFSLMMKERSMLHGFDHTPSVDIMQLKT